MTRPDYNALQPERNAYNRKVDPYKPPQIGTELRLLCHVWNLKPKNSKIQKFTREILVPQRT